MLQTQIRHWPFPFARRETSGAALAGGIALAVAIFSGSTFNAFAKLLTGALSPLSLLFVSEILTAFFVLLTFGTVPTVRKLFDIPRRCRVPLAVASLLAGIVGPFLWFTGLGATSAINAALFAKSDMVFLIVLAHIFLREEWHRGHLFAGIAVVFGIVTITLHGFTDSMHLQPGDLVILAATLAYAIASITFRRHLTDIPSHVVLLTRSLTAITVFFLVSPFIEHPFIAEITAFPAALLPALIGFGFISRFLNTFSYYQAIERLPVSTVSLFGTLDMVGSALFAAWYLREALHWYHFAGGAFIVLGTILLEIFGTHRTKEHLEHHIEQRIAHKP